MYFWAQPCSFIYLWMNKEMIYQFTSWPLLSHPTPLLLVFSGELISCLTHAPRQTEGVRHREGEIWRGGGGGARMARVELETYPFNMSYLSILSVRRGSRRVTLWFKGLTQFCDETAANILPTRRSETAVGKWNCCAKLLSEHLKLILGNSWGVKKKKESLNSSVSNYYFLFLIRAVMENTFKER